MARSTPPLLRNLRLLAQSGLEHLVDDPALLAVQVSRRTPLPVRTRAGVVLRRVGAALPGTALEALGAAMAGDPAGAEEALRHRPASSSRLHAAVAVLLDRPELVPDGAPALSRARATWAQGRLDDAVQLLHQTGQGATRHARRLDSERRLLQPGFRLRAPRSGPAGPPPVCGPEEQMRVLHVLTNSLPHTQSGYSLRSHRILRALKGAGVESVALTRTGYPVMIGAITAADEDVVDGIRYRRCLPPRLGATQEERLAQQVAEALEIVRELRPHVIHTTTPYANALVAQAVSEATGIPWVYEVRGLAEQTWIASHSVGEERAAAASAQKVQLIAAREGELAREAHAVVTLSRTMADELEARGVDPAAITLVPNGVEPGLFFGLATTEEARARLRLYLRGTFLVGAASALVDYEGFDVLLEAVASIIHDGSHSNDLRENLYACLVGDGTEAPRLIAQAQRLGIGDRVVMPGRVGREEARWWIEAMDVVAVPRRDLAVTRSVTPQKPIEAMALTRPVVASDLPAIRESVSGPDGEVGALLVPPGDSAALARAIREVYEDPQARFQLAQRGEAIAYDRRWDVLVRRYETVYGRAVAGSKEVSARGE
ncbi:MAG: glycosyltransferase family 4 protein [Brachybacterium sp.]|uniref:glycosyltransferase family 4 protein n=1 Tax=Brachybacterium sp. TaxID=1891286 RepID=UPI00324209B2